MEFNLMNQEKKTFRAAGIQLSPVLFDRDGTTEKAIKAIGKCGQEGIRLAVFPETFIPNYPYFSRVQPPAVIAELHVKFFDERMYSIRSAIIPVPTS
jgi:nitrilase